MWLRPTSLDCITQALVGLVLCWGLEFRQKEAGLNIRLSATDQMVWLVSLRNLAARTERVWWLQLSCVAHAQCKAGAAAGKQGRKMPVPCLVPTVLSGWSPG